MLAKEANLTRNLRRIVPHSTTVIDFKENGDGDALILYHNSLRIIDRGVSGKRFAAWVREDSVGPSPVLKGEEKQKWDLFAGNLDLVDARLCATMTLGPHFIRQAWHGNRFDQSRLDRFYISGRGEWAYHIRTVDHQGAKTLLDHVPIKLEVLLEATEAASRPRRSYFKMEFKTLMKTDILARVRATWQEHPTWAKDKRKRWALALCRIRKLLMEVRREEKRMEEEKEKLEDIVERVRLRIQEEGPSKVMEEFEEVVSALRAKHVQEEMTALEIGPGQTIEEPEEILEEVFRFYRDLYKAEEEKEEILESRRR
ncbi:hypothetical protein R1sor_015950 [Riccia sorocarpa]|uniref:Uncharacterized protein n=1 Tax=Riccia sorocarpa TaxID=122646 RepID=A0ABD3HFH4_9MARC